MLLPVFLVLPCHPGRGDALRWAPFLSDKKWGNALSGFSSILASQNGPQRSVPRQAGKPAPETLEEDDPSRREPIRCTLPLTIPPTGDIVSPSKWRGRRRAEISSCPERDVFGASILQLPSAVPLPSCPGHDRDGTLPLQRTQAARCRALLAIRVEPWSISAWNRREQHGWTGARAKNKICWQICFLPESEGSRASRTGAA